MLSLQTLQKALRSPHLLPVLPKKYPRFRIGRYQLYECAVLCIPFGMALQLAPWQAYLMALCGSFFVVCFLAFFTHWFYVECKKHGFLKRFIGWIDKIVTKNKDKIHKYGPLAIFAYVAVPIPGTGTWTGSIIAGVLNMRPGITIFCGMCGYSAKGL